MKIKKISILCVLCIALGALTIFSGGCSSNKSLKTPIPTKIEPKPQSPPKSKPAAPEKEVASSAGSLDSPQTPDDPIKATASKADYLSMYIIEAEVIEGTTPEESSLAVDIAENLAGLIKETKEMELLFDPEAAHVFLTVKPTLKTIDIAGEYYRMGCSVDLSICSSKTGNLLAQKKITLQDGRKLGKDAAIQQFVEPASEKASQWVINSMEKIAASKIGVELVTFQLASIQTDDKKMSSLIQTVANELTSMEGEEGIISFECVSQDSATKTCTFKIVYEKEKFKKTGLINSINQKFK